MLQQHDTQDLIARLERLGTHRVLTKLDIRQGRTGIPYHGGETFIAVVIDVETTGLDHANDVIIELALRRFRYDGSGRVLKIDRAIAWLEDPGRPLDENVTRITGLTDAGIAGQRIDDGEAARLIRTAHLVIAHNAAFDRKFVERRLPEAAGMPWACSMAEVDWGQAGFEGRSLGWLGAQMGWFHAAHRASDDVDAVIGLLSHVLADGRTVLSKLIERSAQPSMRIEAAGADFSVKDKLRVRGYRWDPESKVWWREVCQSELADEETWLGLVVYGPECRPRSSGPLVFEITARERFA